MFFSRLINFILGLCALVGCAPSNFSIAIDKFFTNYNDAAITVCATIEGIEITRTWRYADRNNDQRTPFNLSDCNLESGEDPRKNFTTMNYCFMIREEDLTIED